MVLPLPCFFLSRATSFWPFGLAIWKSAAASEKAHLTYIPHIASAISRGF